jgi:hypothetical protein
MRASSTTDRTSFSSTTRPRRLEATFLGINNHGEAAGKSGTVYENGQAILIWEAGEMPRSVQVPSSHTVTLSLFDVMGRLVARPVDGARPAGGHAVTWNGRTMSGRRAPSGVYFVRLATPGFTASRRLTLAR